jgi:DNA repair protein RadC
MQKLELIIGKAAAAKLAKSGINILQASEQEIQYIAGKSAAQKIAAAKSLIMTEPKSEQIRSSNCAFQLLADLAHLDHEQFVVLALNRANKVIDRIVISAGGADATVVDMKILYKRLIIAGAAGFIAAHNHPSGNLNPSEADLQLTKKMVEAGKILDLKCYDHLIVAGSGYYSFADNGLF